MITLCKSSFIGLSVVQCVNELPGSLDYHVTLPTLCFRGCVTTACFFLGANIFLTSSGLIKLGDFGCSVKLKNNAQTMPGEVNSTLGTAGRDQLGCSLHSDFTQHAWDLHAPFTFLCQ